MARGLLPGFDEPQRDGIQTGSATCYFSARHDGYRNGKRGCHHHRDWDGVHIPQDFPIDTLLSFSNEVREKFKQISSRNTRPGLANPWHHTRGGDPIALLIESRSLEGEVIFLRSFKVGHEIILRSCASTQIQRWLSHPAERPCRALGGISSHELAFVGQF